MTKDEALQMCLEYIETDAHERKYVRHAIKEALAQSEQEPVAWFSTLPDGKLSIKIVGKPTDGNWEPLYTTPPQRTEQEREACERCKQLEEQAYDLVGELRVANIKLSMRPQRTWVGLTYEEETELIRLAHNHAGIRFYIQAAEAKLRSKNNG